MIGGDFNTSIMLPDGKTEVNTPEDYEPFRKAGYVGAHWGTLATWPSEKPVLTIDNIFAKGLNMSDVEVLTDPLLSDHSLLRCRLTFPALSLSRSGDLQPRSGNLPPRSGVMSPGGDMTEPDFRTLADWGATLLRFQMVRDWHGVDGNRDLAEYDRWLEGRLDHVDKVVLPLALQYGIRVVLDLHVPPGGRDAGAEANMFYEPEFAEHFVELWRNIARRFRGRYGLYGYDLLNEPCHKREPAPGCSWPELARRAAKAVREEDPFATIVVEPNLWGGPEAFGNLEPLPIDNVVYEVHEGEDDTTLRPSADNPRKRALLEGMRGR